MEFFKNNFLNAKELETLVDSLFPNDKSTLIGNKLKDFIIIKDERLYVLNKNITYEVSTTDIKSNLLTVCTFFIEQSFKALSDNESEMLRLKFPKTLGAIFQNSAVDKYYPQLLIKFNRPDVKFDDDICMMHFTNGYIDFEDLKFKQRQIGKHYVTKHIQRDYQQSTQAEQDEVLSHVKKVYPMAEDLDCICSILGSALSGKATNEQDLLFLLGLASSGKSFILELTGLSIECYFKELKEDTFSQQNSKIDKILNSFESNPQIRIIWINEPKDTKMDGSVIKNLVDGKIQVTQLYKDGSYTIIHRGKIVLTSNDIPNFAFCSGIVRRIRAKTHTSEFTKDPSLVNPAKHIYLVDKDILEKLKMGNLRNAWFDILAKRCNLWLKGEPIKYPASFQETKDSLVSNNDIFQDFIDTHLTITNNTDDDRISKEDMQKVWHEMYPKSILTFKQVMNSLRTKKILYETKCRAKCQKTQGCFVGVKFQDKYVELEDENEYQFGKASPLDYGIMKNIDYKAQYEDALKQIEELKAQITKLQKPEEQEQVVIVKPKKKKQQTMEELDEMIAEQEKPKFNPVVEDDDAELEAELEALANQMI